MKDDDEHTEEEEEDEHEAALEKISGEVQDAIGRLTMIKRHIDDARTAEGDE